MTTPNYTNFDSANPSGTQTPTAYAVSDLDNLKALRDAILTGRVGGFVMSRTTGTGPDAARPQYITWTNGALAFRSNATWGGTGNWQITSIAWEYTADSGGEWKSLGTAQANTYDGSNNITSTTNSGGVFTLFIEVWTKLLKLMYDFYTGHAGTAVGSAHSGVGTIASQAANSVALTGGTMSGVAIDNSNVGETTPALGRFVRVKEKYVDLGTTSPTLDWNAGSCFKYAPGSGSTTTITHSNKPGANQYQGVMIMAVGWGSVTSLTHGITWVGGTPTFKTGTGVDWIGVWCADNGTIYGSKTS
jgi:hypothetical protein